jgi:ribosome-binding ATPase YchF (GTP1/OBG family)
MEQAMIFTDSVLTGDKIRKMVGYNGIEIYSIFLKQILNETEYTEAVKTIQNLFLEGEDLSKFVWDFLDFLNGLILVRENLAMRENVNLPAEDIKKMQIEFADINLELLEDLHLLTAKPVIYLFNVDEQTLSNDSKKTELANLVAPAQSLFVCAKLEDELKNLDEVDRTELLESYGQTESGLIQLIHAAYKTLGLQSYLTAGEVEVRAWTIHKGWTAPQAAGVIHTDFEKGFIAAQVVDYTDLVAAGSEIATKAAGKMRTEGKTYVMQPGDIVEFRFNV